jgi:hypothetical protein
MNRCKEIPASRNKGDTGSETPFSAFFEEFKRTVLACFLPIYLMKWNEGGRIHTL